MFLAMLRSETAEDEGRRAAALQGLRLYQQASRPARVPPPPEIASAGRACLRDYGGSGPPLVMVPSLINPPDVLDLDGEQSLLRWLATQGVRPLLVDWGTPGTADRGLTVAAHIETMLLPLLDGLGEAPLLAGYCLGGTMALAAAALRPARALALLATPWSFSGYPPATHAALGELWEQAAPASEALGLMPMEVLQAAFWRLDPGRTVRKYEALAGRAPNDPTLARFVRLEDWANDGPPLTHAAARELFDDLFEIDQPGRGRWMVAGQAIDPARIRAPVLQIVSTTDRIVPAASAAGIGERIDLALGHVGMIVGGGARAQVWEPLAAWLSAHAAS